MISPGLRVECPFAICEDCGTTLTDPQITRLVKSWYPDRSLFYDYLEREDRSAWHEATRTGRILFLYPGKLVGELLDRIPESSRMDLYGKDFLR